MEGNDRGERIREAALRLFARHGYAAVSMRQIATEVGVQAGALYLYIPDKQTLLFDMMRSQMEELLAAWDELPAAGAPVARLEAFVRFHICYNLARPDAAFLGAMEMRNLEPENYRAVARLRDGYEAELAAILRDGAASGAMRVPDVRLATKAVLAMLNGVTGWYREGGRLSRERVERIYWNMVRRAVGA
ncbi:TetR/AcrR family transcriptional regulator [Psychromarinibacter sp. C21-152]|uniref:TetR/AcrR family transcriptional regulator n=2 Tax=Psychromarinibacter sediminicola TaxID=3033385 RepID=A0AAE3TBF1_9RHOB|nr:TetR/AcrR family transcriptional regulator [Psychromarinibacter sediminicola]